MKIGIDIGNVIIGGGGDDTQFFGPDYIETPMVKGARKFIRELALEDHELHIVSKCGEKVEIKTLDWLDYWSFHMLIPAHRIHFVRKRHLKAPMAQALELDIFIDDRQDIIDTMEGVVKFPILFTSWEETNKQLKEIFEAAQR